MQRWMCGAIVAIAGGFALGCEATEAEPQRSCLAEQCRGISLEVTRLGTEGATRVIEAVHAETSGLTCNPVRIRGSVRCVPVDTDCGWRSVEEAEVARAEVERALASLRADGSVEDGGEAIVSVDECACTSYVEQPCAL